MYIWQPHKALPTSGNVVSFKIYARRTGDIYMQVTSKSWINDDISFSLILESKWFENVFITCCYKTSVLARLFQVVAC